VGAALVAVALAAYLVIADPFAGPLPDGWVKKPEKALGVTLAVPAGYEAGRPEEDDSDQNWVTYGDPSGSVWIGLNVARRAEDSSKQIKDSARDQMWADNAEFKQSGEYRLDMPAAPRTDPQESTHQGGKSAVNTLVYKTTDSEHPRLRELRIFYYKSAKTGDMYKLTVSYPGKGDFTERGREVARTAIANLDIAKP
jgi:hypothetical protein